MSELLGGCRQFEWQGMRCLIAPVDLFTERHFSDWVAMEAGLTLARLKNKWPPDFWAEQNKLLNAKINGKRFTWGSEDVHSAVWSEEGHRQLLWLKIERGAVQGGEHLEREQIDEIAKDKAKWQELTDILYQQDFPDFFAKLEAERETEKKSSSPPPPSPS